MDFNDDDDYSSDSSFSDDGSSFRESDDDLDDDLYDELFDDGNIAHYARHELREINIYNLPILSLVAYGTFKWCRWLNFWSNLVILCCICLHLL